MEVYERFNRNIVECKDHQEVSVMAGNIRFNRNIVECKVWSFRLYSRSDYSFNRNIVECKAILSFPDRSPEGVLIETLWNVK